MEYLPVNLDLRGRKALLIGGGQVATRKARVLLRAGAWVGIVSPEISGELQQWVSENRCVRLADYFQPEHIEGVAVVICATDDGALNARVAGLATQKNVPVNVVDEPRLCTFIVPAIVDRSPVTIAISSGGAAPVLARRIREKLEAELPQRLGALAATARSWRERVKAAIPDMRRRRHFWESFFEQSTLQPNQGMDNGASELEKQLQAFSSDAQGSVFLVGAGPGDPELLTLKALRILQRADVILYDRLVSTAVLELARRDAERISVGKQHGGPSVDQDETNRLMVEHARAGLVVCRLKGGDPLMFGRGGEEAHYVTRHGIECEIVPGITAAVGCAASAGIPLTHRDVAQSCEFITGHRRLDDEEPDWRSLARPGKTLVFYMGLSKAAKISARLMQHGLPGDHPVAIIEKGTTPDQRVVSGSLVQLPELVARAGVQSPALIVVGEVTELALAGDVQSPMWTADAEAA